MTLSEQQCLYIIEKASAPITEHFSTFWVLAFNLLRYTCFRKRLAHSNAFSFKFYFVFGVIQFPFGLLHAIILPHCPPGCACTDPWQQFLVSNYKRYLELSTGVYILFLAFYYYRKIQNRARRRASPRRAAAANKTAPVGEEWGGLLDW